MIQYFEPGRLGKGVVKIVNAERVESLMEAGWELVAMITAPITQTLHEEIPHPSASRSDHYGSDTIHISRDVGVGQTAMFLLRRVDAVGVVEELRAKLKEAEKAKFDAEKEYQEQAKAAANYASDLRRADKRNEVLANNTLALREQVRKMEDDFAKIRQYYGDKEINEALAAE